MYRRYQETLKQQLIGNQAMAGRNNDDDDWIPDDEEWKPPTEAEMKVLQAKRERSDKISKLMGDYLLKGYKMLGSSCNQCGTILLQSKQGVKYCVACSELDSDTVKDDPALSSDAARRQAAEQDQRTDTTEIPGIVTSTLLNSTTQTTDIGQSTEVNSCNGMFSQYLFRPCPEADIRMEPTPSLSNDITNEIAVDDHVICGADIANSVTNHESGSKSDVVQSGIKVVEQRLKWATDELRKCASIESSIHLCQLIKTCAETLSVLKKV